MVTLTYECLAASQHSQRKPQFNTLILLLFLLEERQFCCFLEKKKSQFCYYWKQWRLGTTNVRTALLDTPKRQLRNELKQRLLAVEKTHQVGEDVRAAVADARVHVLVGDVEVDVHVLVVDGGSHRDLQNLQVTYPVKRLRSTMQIWCSFSIKMAKNRCIHWWRKRQMGSALDSPETSLP